MKIFQDEETALLQQAIAMSMSESQPGQSSGGMADNEMPDAITVDQDLAHGLCLLYNFLCLRVIIC